MSIEYSEKLKDPRWQKKRLKIFQRDKWRCRFCGEKEKTICIHHIFYFAGKDPWEINDGFLITLCEDCHSKVNKENGIDLKGNIGDCLNEIWKSDCFKPNKKRDK